MKKLLGIGILALMMATSAFAVERSDLFRFDFDCEFHEGSHHCNADATVFANVRDWDHMQAGNLVDLLSVKCDGRLVYSNGAVLNSRRRFVEISSPSGDPAIFVERRDHHPISTEWMDYDAALRIRDHDLDGTCRVRAVDVDRR